MKQIKSITVPKHDDYRIEDEYKLALKRIPGFITFFPHYEEQKNYLPPRQYFWEVYHTLDQAHVEAIVDSINQSAGIPAKD